MVAAEYIRTDPRPSDPRGQVLGDQEVVDPPSCVILPGVEPVAPPGIRPCGVGVKVAEGIYEPSFQEPAELTRS